MNSVALAILPTFLLIGAGWILPRIGLLTRGFWVEADRLLYFVLFPALLTGSVAKADLGSLAVGEMAAVIVGAQIIMTLLLLALRPAIGGSGASFTSLYQGVIRMNTYLAFGVAYAVVGPSGVEAAAVAVAIFVPTANLLCVTILVRYASGTPGSLRRTLLAIGRNPLILAILAGLLLNGLGIGRPPVLGPMLDILGQGALPLGLLAVGAGVNLSAVQGSSRLIALATLLKLAVMPLLVWGLCQAVGLEGLGAFAVILLNAMPTASAAYILARQLGGNAPLMAAIITVETGVTLVSLPLVLGFLT